MVLKGEGESREGESREGNKMGEGGSRGEKSGVSCRESRMGAPGSRREVECGGVVEPKEELGCA